MRQKAQNERSVMVATDLVEVVRKRSGSGFGEVVVMTDLDPKWWSLEL